MADVIAERQRQLTTGGYSHEHDDEHTDGALAAAAAAFLCSSLSGGPVSVYPESAFWGSTALALYPGDWGELKQQTRRSDLIRGAALAIAEIERLDRLAARAVTSVDTATSQTKSEPT